MSESEQEDNDSEGAKESEYMEERLAVDPTTIRERIDGALEVLNNLKSRRDKTISRSEIIAALSK